VGKSALLREMCRRARLSLTFPNGVFLVNADSVVSLDAGFRAMAIRPPLSMVQFREVGTRAGEVREAVLHWLATHPGWLLVLDNADDPGAVEPYLPRGPVASAGFVLVSTRDSGASFPDAVVERVDVLPPAEGVAVLVSVRDGTSLGAAQAVEALGGRGSAQEAAAVWLAGREGVHGLALALAQAGAYIREQVGVYALVQRIMRLRLRLCLRVLACPCV
jgi:hypothetical protein